MPEEFYKVLAFILIFGGLPAIYVGLWAFVRYIVNKFPNQ